MSTAGAVVEHRADDRDALAQELAASVASDLQRAVRERGAASLVVSGGSTPQPFFAALARQDLPWPQVGLTLADERWVEQDDDASNEGLVRRHLMTGGAVAARFVGLKNAAATPEEGRDDCETALASLARPFDVVVLGMGGDGHTASLFPGTAELAAGLDPRSDRLCVAVRPLDAPHPRMSLTLAALLDSRRVVLHITGQSKWEVYQEARRTGSSADYPIAAVLASGHPSIDVYWAP